MKKKDLIPAFFWMGLSIAVVFSSYRLQVGTLRNPGPGLMPFLLGILLFLCSIPVLVRALLIIKRDTQQEEERIWSGVDFKKLILVLFSLVCYALILERIGFAIATFLLLVVLFKVIGSRRWPFALMTSVIVVLLSYLLFVVLLKIEMPSGPWRIS